MIHWRNIYFILKIGISIKYWIRNSWSSCPLNISSILNTKWDLQTRVITPKLCRHFHILVDKLYYRILSETNKVILFSDIYEDSYRLFIGFCYHFRTQVLYLNLPKHWNCNEVKNVTHYCSHITSLFASCVRRFYLLYLQYEWRRLDISEFEIYLE